MATGNVRSRSTKIHDTSPTRALSQPKSANCLTSRTSISSNSTEWNRSKSSTNARSNVQKRSYPTMPLKARPLQRWSEVVRSWTTTLFFCQKYNSHKSQTDRPPLQKSSSFPAKSPHKSGNGTTSSSSSKSGIARPHMIPKPTELHKPLSDAERQEKRQKQFQAAFKPKTDSGSSTAGTDQDTPDAARRVIEQSRHKQNQILKGVRTNKRFELLMKFRDAQE